jgi:hypothetical protein
MKNLLLLISTVVTFPAAAQIKSSLDQQLVSNFSYGTMIELKDNNGRPIITKKYDPDVQGSPFFTDDWAMADVFLINGASFKQVKLKLNIENNELNYLDSAHQTLVLKKGIIKEIHFFILKPGGADTLIFKNGYPKIDNADTTTYFQVLADGAMSMLKLNRKTISVLKNDLSGQVEKEFTAYTDYYIFYNGEIKLLKRNKQFFVDLMKAKKGFVENNIIDKNINFKNTESLQRLVGLFNNAN